ncbi:MAG: hypothetical protein ACYTG2_10220 [Planctomycetota bacterium]|jgi:hypothetical protein
MGTRWLAALVIVAAGCTAGASRNDAPRQEAPPREVPPHSTLPEVSLAEDGPPRTAADERSLERLSTILLRLQQQRERDFKEPVVVGFYTRDQMRDWMTEKLAKDIPPGYWDAAGRTMVAFGLLPEETDLEALMLDVLTIAVGGFYDAERDQLYALTSDLGALNQFVMIHECAHALQEQHASLTDFAMDPALLENEDLAIGRSSVVEGGATFITNRVIQRHGEELFDADDFDVKGLTETFVQQMAASGALPPILADGMTFPYMQGERFVAEVHAWGGWEAVNALYDNPPVSSEQVLHPEKYLPGPEHDTPLPLRAPDLAPQLGEGWSTVHRNRLGELGTRQLVQFTGDPADTWRASWGWDGDEYRLYGRDGEDDVLQWVTAWDSEKDAIEFVDALANVIERQAGADSGLRVERDDQASELRLVDREGGVYEIVGRVDAWVVWLRGLDPGMDADALAARCLP